MAEVSGITGCAFKLVSQRDVVLGTITVPSHWAETLRKEHRVKFYYSPPISFGSAFGNLPITVDLTIGWLERSFGNHSDALVLHGMSLEQFESCRGCSFSPSAAYLRSIVE